MKKNYRSQTAQEFAAAAPGSINLYEKAEQYNDPAELERLKGQLGLLAMEPGPEGFGCMMKVVDQIREKVRAAAFPLKYVNYGAAIYGSARLRPNHAGYQEAAEIARGLVSESRIDIVTGGGPGIMEAATVGQKIGAAERMEIGKRNGTIAQGLPVSLPFEERPNPHLDAKNYHETFGTRLDDFADLSNSSISWTGGMGTELENAYMLQLKQVGHLEADFPIILKRDMWERIMETKLRVMRATDVPMIGEEDLGLVDFVDDTDEATQKVLDHYQAWKKGVWAKLDGNSQEYVMNMR